MTQLRSIRVWRKAGEALATWAVRSTRALKAPGCHVMAGFGAGKLIFASTYKKFNQATAIRILKRSVYPALKRVYPLKRRFIVMMDGDPAFRAHLFLAALKDLKITKFTVPPRSGDLAPMENVWAHVVKDLAKVVMRTRRWAKGAKNNAKNRRDWQKLVLRTVRKRSSATLRKLVAGMPRRVLAVIQNRGGPTRW